jgi:hypothetical protein
MSKTDPDELDPRVKARLRAELNAVRPPSSLPRYATERAPVGAWRLAPVALAVAFTGILALTAFAATGSPNPAVWTNRVETVINPPSPSPTPESEPTGEPRTGSPAAPTHRPTAEPSEQPEPANTPEPTESPEPPQSPEPSDDHQSPSPSPSSFPPDDH